MKKFVVKSLAAILFVLFSFIYKDVNGQCTANSWASWGSSGTAASPSFNANATCTGLTIAPPNTGYSYFSANNGTKYTFTATGGTGWTTPSISIYKSTTSGGSWAFFAGSSGSSVTFTADVTTNATNNYIVVVNNGNACLPLPTPGLPTPTTANSAVLNYRQVNPTVASISVSYTCSNTNFSSSGGGPFYQWQGSNDNSLWSNISGATGTTYSTTAATNPQYAFYRLLSFNGSCSQAPSASINVVPRANAGAGNAVISSNTVMGGTYNVNGNFTLNSGVTITGIQGCPLVINATNITVSGTINESSAGQLGGAGGAGGTGATGSGCGTVGRGLGGSAGGSPGGGAAGGNGGNGGCADIDCGFLCAGGNDGYRSGAGGGGSGGGGAYGAAAGGGGNGSQGVGGGSYPAAGVGGTAGGAGSAHGTATGADIAMGGGGGGAGGGGGGWNGGGAGQNGGNGGGAVSLIASNTVTISGTVTANGQNGGNGGQGGSLNGGGYNCGCVTAGLWAGSSDCRDNSTCGVCTYYTYPQSGGGGGGGGAGAGGGVLIQAFGLATITGTITANGGTGGASGGPGPNQGGCIFSNRAGAGGSGGRIKFFLNPCHNNVLSGTYQANLGNGGAATNGNNAGNNGGAGTTETGLIHPSYAAPVAGTISSSQTICSGNTPAAFTGAASTGGIGTYTYNWFSCAGGACATPADGQTSAGAGWSDRGTNATGFTEPSALSSTTTYIRRTITGVNGCTRWSNVITVTVNPSPTVNIGGAIPSFCQGGTTTALGGSVGGGATGGTWSTTAGGTFNPSATTLNATWTPPTLYSGTASLVLTTSGGSCGTTSASKSVVVSGTPSVSNAGTMIEICNTTSATLSGNIPAVGTGAWSVVTGTASITTPASNTSGVTGLAAAINSSPFYSSATLRWTISNGTCTPSTSDVVIRNYFPSSFGIAVGGNSNICLGSSQTIAMVSSIASTYQWQESTTGSAPWTNISLATGTTYNTPSSNPAGPYYYRGVAKNGPCTADTTGIIQVDVNPLVTMNSASSAQTICTGTTPAALTGSTPSGGNGSYGYQWQISTTSASGGFSNIGGATSKDYTIPSALTQTTWYKRRVASGGCTDFSTAVEITVSTPGTAANAGADQNICGANGQLAGNTATVGIGAWSVLGGGAATVASSGSPTSMVSTLDPGNNTFEWKITNGACVSRDTVVIKSASIPNDIPSIYAYSSLSANTTITANFECLASNGWTHYIYNGADNTLNTADDILVISLKKNGNNIGKVGDGTFVAKQVLTSGYGNDGHKITTTNASYVNNNVSAWAVMGRYWDVVPTTQPSTDSVLVRFYYDDQDFGDIVDRLNTEGWEALQGSNTADKHKQLQYYKVHSSSGKATDPTSGHLTISTVDDPTVHGEDGEIVLYQNSVDFAVAPVTPKPLHEYKYQFMYGEYHYAEMPVWSFSGGGGGSGGGGQGALPVKLMYFTAKAIENQYIQLDWATALEIDNKGFEVERSVDGLSFESIGWVVGNNNSTSQIQYSFNDKTAKQDVRYYYRLKQIDNDGGFEYSALASAILVSDLKTAIGDFVPNPTGDKSYIEFFATKAQVATITVFDATGKLIRNESIAINKGFNTYNINAVDLASSVYMVNFRFDDQRFTKRLNVVK